MSGRYTLFGQIISSQDTLLDVESVESQKNRSMELIQDVLARQVCSQQQAKRIHELGVKTPSLFYWSQQQKDEWEIKFAGYVTEINGKTVSYYHAYTLIEILSMIPDELIYKDKYNKPVVGHFRMRFMTGGMPADMFVKYTEVGYIQKQDRHVIDFRECDPSPVIATTDLLITLLLNRKISNLCPQD